MRPVGSTPATRSATHGFRLSYRQITNPPTNLNTDLSLSIAENQPVGSFIGTFTATDVDPNPTLSYYLINGTGDADNSLFALETNGTLKTATTFDYESNASTYSIRVQVRDEFNASMEGNFTVTLENANEAPLNLHNTGPLTMAENAPINTVVGNFNASDPDIGTILTYSLVNGAGDGDNFLFSMETNMGRLRTAAMFDYENNASSYSIRVAVSDSYGLSTEQSFTVTLTDVIENLPPVDLNSSAELSIAENQPMGSTVGSFTATDPDGDAITFHLVGGDGDGNNSLFTLDQNGILRTAAVLDYEAGDALSIRVQVSDELNATLEGNFTITLTDVYEPPPNASPADLNSSGPLTIAENQAMGTYVGEFVAMDPDGDPLIYSLVNGQGDGDNSSFFLDANGSLSTALVLDFESGPVLSIRVRVADESNASVDGIFSVEIIDLDELAPTLVLNGSSLVTHSVGTPFIDPGARWTDNLDGTGMVTSSSPFDASVVGTYSLGYEFMDAAGNPAPSVTRTVYVLDLTPPEISLLGEMTMTHEGGTPFIDPGATWTDNLDGNGTIVGSGEVNYMAPGIYLLRYDHKDLAENQAATQNRTVIVQDTTAPVISLNGESSIQLLAGTPYLDSGASWTDAVDGDGMLSPDGVLDPMTPGVYTLSFDYTDKVGNEAEQVIRTVEITNQDPHAIYLSRSEVEENMPAGTLVGQVSASDPDDPEGGMQGISLELVPMDSESSLFSLNSQNELRTTVPLDFETSSFHTVRIRASDPYGGVLEQEFVIEVVDAFLPIVDTWIPQMEETTAVSLQGQVVDPGGSSEILEVGFLISRLPIGGENDPDAQKRTATLDENNFFSSNFFPIYRGTKHYLIAYAINAEGIHYGLEETFISTDFSMPDPWSMAVENPEAPSWWSSPWFGNYYKSEESGWILHEQLGWLFPNPIEYSGIWLWQEGMGWLWTSEQTYPFLYRNFPAGWTFFYGFREQSGLFFDYTQQKWIVLDQQPPLKLEDESEY
jgi:hypothetical protein